MDATDPLVAKFYVRLALHGEHGRIRIFDDGPRTAFRIPGANEEWAKGRESWYDIQLSDIVLRRLAQMPTDWARKNYVANTLELDLSAHTIPCKTESDPSPQSKNGADIHASGELDNYWDTPYGGNWNLALDVKNPTDVAHLHQEEDGRRQPRWATDAHRAVHRAAKGDLRPPRPRLRSSAVRRSSRP